MLLETTRLYLREMKQGDFTDLCKILQDKHVMYAYEHAFDDMEVQEWLDRQMTRYKKHGFGLWAVILKDTDEMIGQCGLSLQNCDGKQVLEIGYLFQKAFWHKGYAIEAASACKRYAFERLEADEVFSIIRDNNLASQEVAKRNGMILRGQFIKHYYNINMPHLIFSIKWGQVMANTPEIETQRLVLRRFTESDVEALFLILKDKEVNTFLPWLPFESLEETKKYLQENYIEIYKTPIAYQYAICLKENNIPIGYLHISEDDSHDFGYALRKEFWHKGIVTEACKGVIAHLKEVGFSYITATHDINNPRSGGVMKNIGMTYQYTYEELWEPKNMVITFRMYQMNFDGKENRIYDKYWNKYPIHFIEKDI